LTRAQFEEIADGEVRRCVQTQVEAGVDVVVDGEQRRDIFYSFITDKQKGFLETARAPLFNLIPDYVMPGIPNEALATILAGIVGALSETSDAHSLSRSLPASPQPDSPTRSARQVCAGGGVCVNLGAHTDGGLAHLSALVVAGAVGDYRV
jgi:hypothetical protein